MAPGLALVATSLGLQLGLSWALPSPTQIEAICILLCSLCQVALSSEQAVADLDLHLPGGPISSVPSGQIQTTYKHHPTTTTSDIPKGKTQWAPEPH